MPVLKVLMFLISNAASIKALAQGVIKVGKAGLGAVRSLKPTHKVDFIPKVDAKKEN